MNWALRVLSTELRKILAYRADFWVNFVGQVAVQLFIAHALWAAILQARGVESLNGMNLHQLTLYYLLAPTALKALQGENIGFFSKDIYEGGLNRFLVWPLPPVGYKLLTYMAHSVFFLVQMGLLFLAARLFWDTAPFLWQDGLRLVMGLVWLAVGCLAFFCLLGLCEMCSFWAENIWTLGVMLRFVAGFLGGTFVPLAMFPEQVRAILDWLPFACMLGSPVNFILGHAGPWESLRSFMILLAWLPLLWAAVGWVWRRGSLRYTGVGM